jgi:hypothetical protein
MLTPEDVVFAALVVLVVVPWLLPFVMGPIRMRSRSWQSADPVYSLDDEGRLPLAARRTAADLRALGFEDRGTWRHQGAALATGRVILLEHPRNHDVARVNVVAVRTRVSVTLAFQTCFADETEVWTANNRLLSGFPPLPGVTVVWLPELRDAAQLCHVHTQLADALGGARKRRGIGADPAAFLRDVSTRSLANWVRTGYYALDADRGVVRPTWKGAALITWRLCWPVKPLFRARRQRTTQQMLDRLGIALEPMLGREAQ